MRPLAIVANPAAALIAIASSARCNPAARCHAVLQLGHAPAQFPVLLLLLDLETARADNEGNIWLATARSGIMLADSSAH